MTASQLAVEIIIALAAIVVGVFLKAPLERFHEFLKRPSPLTPKTRGQWTEYLAMTEQSLARIEYLNTHPRDLYIYFFQLVFAAMTFDEMAVVIFIWAYANPASPQNKMFLSVSIVLLVLGMTLSILGIYEGNRLSQKRIDATRANLQKQIEQFKKLLAGPPS